MADILSIGHVTLFNQSIITALKYDKVLSIFNLKINCSAWIVIILFSATILVKKINTQSFYFSKSNKYV